MNNLINISNMSFSYPLEKEKILNDINLHIPAYSFTVIVGASGCGKSTLLKIVSGIEKSTHGDVETQGSSSFVFQSGALLPWRTVKQNVYLGVETENISDDIKHKRVTDAIKLMDMYEFEKEYPRNLSGGQRQRVGIARALATSPDILFLDEPFSALDPETTERLHQDLIRIWKENKVTILMVSHSMEEAVLLADTIIIMEKGRIEITINLPRPRDENSDLFHQTVKNVRLALGKPESRLR